MRRALSHQWTKREIESVIQLWESKTVKELADELELNEMQINYMAKAIRDAGHKLPKKRKIGQLRLLVQEVLGDLQLK